MCAPPRERRMSLGCLRWRGREGSNVCEATSVLPQPVLGTRHVTVHLGTTARAPGKREKGQRSQAGSAASPLRSYCPTSVPDLQAPGGGGGQDCS